MSRISSRNVSVCVYVSGKCNLRYFVRDPLLLHQCRFGCSLLHVNLHCMEAQCFHSKQNLKRTQRLWPDCVCVSAIFAGQIQLELATAF